MAQRLAVVLVGLVLALGSSANSAAAQREYIFGFTAAAAAPTGDLGDIAGTGFGGSLFLGMMVGDGLMLKADAGYWAFSSETITLTGVPPFEVDGGVFPFRVGLRKYWGESKRFYTGPNIGIYVPGGDLDGLKSHFGLGPQIGLRFPMAGGKSIDLVAEFHTIFIGDENPLTNGPRTFFQGDKVSFLSVGVGYSIGSLGN